MLRCGKLDALLVLFFQTHIAPLTAVAVDELLRENRAQPSFERSLSGVGRERGNPRPVTQAVAVKIGAERISEFPRRGAFFRDIAGFVVELLAISNKKSFPRSLVACGASASQCQFFNPKPGVQLSRGNCVASG